MQINVRSWLDEMIDRFHQNPTRAPLYVVYTWYLVLWYAITSRITFGTNVYEREWDVLIVLDACRVDTLEEVADEYDFIDDIDTIWSVGSQSDEWMAKTFTAAYEEQIEKTRYITANGHVEQLFNRGVLPPKNNTTPLDFSKWNLVSITSFSDVEMVWETHHDETYRVATPRVMTDHAIHTCRESTSERVIVHYMQPHLPYIGRAFREGRAPTDLEFEGYNKLERGETDRSTVYDLYKETLRLVLDEVELLLENMDAERVVITADHGEAFGEFAAYGHPEGFLHPVVKKVPWVTTSGKDTGSHEPEITSERDQGVDIEQHLKDLGYR